MRRPTDDQDLGDWKMERNRKALRQAAERLRWRERERRDELARRLDEYGGEADREPVPRID